MDIFEKIGFIVLGGILAGVSYLLKRWIENKPKDETLNRHKQVLDIHKQMNEQGLDVDGLKNLEDILTGKSNAIKKHSSELFEQSESESLFLTEEQEPLTQKDLNERASQKLGKAKDKLQEVISEIDARVGDNESQALMQSQRSWESYISEQAEATAYNYKDGSIYPLIYMSELESLTNERIARLQAELDEIIQLRG